MAIYGIAWTWAVTEPWHAFFFLLLIGVLASFTTVVEGILKALPWIILGIVLAFTAAAFPLLLILYIPFSIYMLFKKIKTVVSHIFLIVVGIFMYSFLFFAPAHLAHALSLYPDNLMALVLLFIIGELPILLVCYLLKATGYPEEKVARYVVGFPAFILLILFLFQDFSGGDMDA